jgi:hypothetical protein
MIRSKLLPQSSENHVNVKRRLVVSHYAIDTEMATMPSQAAPKAGSRLAQPVPGDWP